jgi:hypothetical protein
VKQFNFAFMIQEFTEPPIRLEQKIEEELVSHVATAIIELVNNEGRKAGDNLSEQ